MDFKQIESNCSNNKQVVIYELLSKTQSLLNSNNETLLASECFFCLFSNQSLILDLFNKFIFNFFLKSTQRVSLFC